MPDASYSGGDRVSRSAAIPSNSDNSAIAEAASQSRKPLWISTYALFTFMSLNKIAGETSRAWTEAGFSARSHGTPCR